MSDHEHGPDCSHDGHGHDGPELSEEERARLSAHIVLDGVSVAFDTDGTDPVELAFSKLLEIEAIELLLDEENDELELDISPLMSGVLLVVRRLVEQLAERTGTTPADVVAAVRAAVDEPA
ncbi:hypothetical protein GCM10022215_31210 [Nocardioides fonticola]|uniref:Carrier domain-containing protein n=1 Tax=Nocardioides fonticola TaxID=450363 RepID=A0ABP7XQM1_9ACTN